MIRLAILAIHVIALCACSSSPLRTESRAIAGSLSQSAEHYIVAAVDNDPVAFTGHAASTPRGYDSIVAYGPSPRALQLMQSIETDYGLREVAAWPIAPLHMHCAILEVSAHADRSTLLVALARDHRIRLAQPLQMFATRSEYNDPYFALQSGFQQMDVADAHSLSQGNGVKIAVIDTGVDTAHPDLRGTIVRSVNFVDADDRQFRRDRHGTEVAGIIAAVANNHEGIVGVAPGARLLVFKACWQLRSDEDAARCNTFTLSQALVAALDAHAQVINLSLSGPQDPLLHALLLEGLRRGIIIVGAAPAGTQSDDNALMQQNGVIQVASAEITSAPEAPQQPGTPLRAPGREILTLLPGGHYDFVSGSSLATAHVTGAVALLLAKHPQLSSNDIYQLLRDSTVQVAADGGLTSSIDACVALAALASHGVCKRIAQIRIDPLSLKYQSVSRFRAHPATVN